jgi:hypothetical protein
MLFNKIGYAEIDMKISHLSCNRKLATIYSYGKIELIGCAGINLPIRRLPVPVQPCRCVGIHHSRPYTARLARCRQVPAGRSFPT